jgi:hypothetical protein
MPGLALAYGQMIKGYQKVLDSVEIDGLVKLNGDGYGIGRMFSLDKDKVDDPDAEKIWRRLETVWIPGELVRADGKPLKILKAYQPVQRQMPVAKEETYGQLRDRIAEETETLAGYVMEETGGPVNAFHLANLSGEYIMGQPAKECMVISGEGILDHARESFELRYTFLTSLFEVGD